MIPGSNVLNRAFRLLATQTIVYHQAINRAENDVGQEVTEYAPSRFIVGSFQPVPRALVAQWGLDWQKSYFNFYTSNNLVDIQRNVSADQISFGEQRYQCISATDWFGIDGWKSILCVLIQGSANANADLLLLGTQSAMTLIGGGDFVLLGTA